MVRILHGDKTTEQSTALSLKLSWSHVIFVTLVFGILAGELKTFVSVVL